VSVHSYKTGDGTRWQVRWRDNGRVRTRSLTSRRDALAFDADVKARKFKGEVLPRQSKDTLADAYSQWLRLRGSNLAPQTLEVYEYAWNAHIRRTGFDSHRLGELVSDPMLVEQLTADMRERGVGPAAQRKALVVLSAVLTAAVQWKKIPTNPVWRMPKPPAGRQRVPHPFPPLLVERIKLRLRRRQTKDGPYRAIGDATLVSLLSYAGLRPGEALALTWADVGLRTLAVDKAVADGVVGATKTGAVRSVPLVQPLRQELDLWKGISRGAADDRFVFPSPEGGPWSRTQTNNWRGRIWRPALESLALETKLERLATAIPYDCRGSFVSLHLRAGASPLEVAAWAGHSPQVMFRHYANVIEELVGEPRLSAEEQINRAQTAVQQRSAQDLDRLVVDLFENPTLSEPGSSNASIIFYEPLGAGITPSA
jgi:integrase